MKYFIKDGSREREDGSLVFYVKIKYFKFINKDLSNLS